MFSFQTWASSPYWVGTGALIGALSVVSNGPGQAHPQSMLIGVGALLLGLGSQRARGLISGAPSTGSRRQLALTSLSILSVWAFSGGINRVDREFEGPGGTESHFDRLVLVMVAARRNVQSRGQLWVVDVAGSALDDHAVLLFAVVGDGAHAPIVWPVGVSAG